MENEFTEELLPYYVYLLKDPRSDSIFYVGKGTGDRANSHLSEALKKDDKETEKLNMIGEIIRSGLEPKVLVIGRYETESEAFAVEATLIKWVYGFDELTNAIQGHRHKSIRQKGVSEALIGIDIPLASKGFFDGSYTKSQRQKIVNNRVLEKLSWIKERLESHKFSVSDPDISIPQDPCLWVDGFHSSIKAQIKLQITGANLVINLRPKNNNQKARQEFKSIVSRHGFESKNEGRYAPIADFKTKDGFPGGFKLEQIDLLVENLEKTLDTIGEHV